MAAKFPFARPSLRVGGTRCYAGLAPSLTARRGLSGTQLPAQRMKTQPESCFFVSSLVSSLVGNAMHSLTGVI